MQNLGLDLIIRGKQYEVNPLSKHPRSCFIGELLTALSDVTKEDLLKMLHSNPRNTFKIDSTYRNLDQSCLWLNEKLNTIYDPISADLITFQFMKEVGNFKKDRTKYFEEFEISFKHTALLSVFIFEDSGYASLGYSTIGQFLLSALVNVCFELRFLHQILNRLIDLTEPTLENLMELFFHPRIRKIADIRYQIKSHNGNLCSLYTMRDIYSLLTFEVHQIIEQGATVKKCNNCGKFFITQTRSDTLYCSRPSPQDKALTCKEYGSKKLWYDRVKADEVANLSRNVYTAKQMLVRRNPTYESYKKLFDYFKIERKAWNHAVKSGDKSPDEYKDWLNMMKREKFFNPKLLETSLVERKEP